MIRSRAAVAWAPGQPLDITEIEVAPPKHGEVLLKIVATGVCHTDAYTLSGADPEGLFPAVLGHEGGAVVVEIGQGVTSVAPGDHVIPFTHRNAVNAATAVQAKPTFVKRSERPKARA